MSRPRHQLVHAADRPPVPAVGNPRRNALWVLCVADRAQIPGYMPSRPHGVRRVHTGPREDRLLRGDLTMPVVGRVDRAASGSHSADQTGTWL